MIPAALVGRRMVVGLVAVVSVVSAVAVEALGQCELLVRETFRPGDRPHGGNGRPRNAQIHDTLKDYWPQWPQDGTRWIGNDQAGVPTWGFAGSSLDPAEVDVLDPYNGTAFGEAPAAAVLAFTPPAGAFTVSAEAVMLFNSTSATYLGCTSSPALLSNFESNGSLWMSLNGRGEWTIRANGSMVVAEGTAPIAGTLDSGWLHMEFTFDPATSMVSGRVMNTVIPPTPVAVVRPMLYVGMEAHESWNVLNNLSISTGTRLAATATGGGRVCRGGMAVLGATTNAPAGAVVRWSREGGWPLGDGVQADGSVVSGSQTGMLTVENARAGSYFCIVSSECGSVNSNPVEIAVCDADYDCSGGLAVGDIFAFLNGWFAGSASADFDGESGLQIGDVFAFLNAWFAGC